MREKGYGRYRLSRIAGFFAGLSLVSIAIAVLYLKASEPPQSNPFLLSAYFKACQQKKLAEQAITRLEAEVQKNRDSAARARKLIDLASQRTDENARRAEETATQALRLAEESRLRNEKSLTEWKVRKARAENSLAAIRNMLAAQPAGRTNFIGSVTDLNGKVEILKKGGSSLSLEGDSPGFLEPGDRVRTTDGTADLQLLGGRAATKLGQDSELEVIEDNPGQQAFELIKGKLHGVVDKTENFMTRLKQAFEDYKEDLATVKDLFTDEDLQSYLKKVLKIYYSPDEYMMLKTLEKIRRGRIPIAVAAVRGTEFVTERHEDGSADLWVLEGEIEITIQGRDEPLLIKPGYKCTITESGVSDPIPFNQLDRWWER